MWDGIDSRRFPRVQAPCDIQILREGEKKVITTVTENIGAGGVCVNLENLIPKGERVKLRLTLKESIAPIECHGKIVWAIEKKTFGIKKKDYDEGIEFLDISDWDRNTVRSFIQKLTEGVST